MPFGEFLEAPDLTISLAASSSAGECQTAGTRCAFLCFERHSVEDHGSGIAVRNGAIQAGIPYPVVAINREAPHGRWTATRGGQKFLTIVVQDRKPAVGHPADCGRKVGFEEWLPATCRIPALAARPDY